MKPLETLGRNEQVQLPEIDQHVVYARVDTGAKTSSIWASTVKEVKGGLKVVFYGPRSPQYTGTEHFFPEFEQVVVVSSNGIAEKRYKIRLLIIVGGRKIRVWFTLADRSTQVYPILIGRNALRNKFIVDVTTFSKVPKPKGLKDKAHAAKIKKEVDL